MTLDLLPLAGPGPYYLAGLTPRAGAAYIDSYDAPISATTARRINLFISLRSRTGSRVHEPGFAAARLI